MRHAVRAALSLQAPQVKYRLPSDPSVWVDVVDEEDVQVGNPRGSVWFGGRMHFGGAEMHLWVHNAP